MAAESGLPARWRWRWGFAHLVVVLIAVLYGTAAPILLAVALPLALELSPLRLEPAYASWLLATLSGAVALWLNAGGLHPAYEYGPTLMALVSSVGFLLGRSRPKAYLIGLSLDLWLVAYLSSGHGGGDSMIAWLRHQGLGQDAAETATHLFRKSVHFIFYGAVGWTTLRAARAVETPPSVAIRTALLAVLALASFDELRQSAYANRTGSAWDVLLDLGGATAFVGLSEWRRRRTR